MGGMSLETYGIEGREKSGKIGIKFIACNGNAIDGNIETGIRIKKRLQNRKSGCIMKIKEKTRIIGGDRYGISGNIN